MRRLRRKWTSGRIHLYRNLASHLIHELWERGVSTIYVGYPYEIVHENGNKYSVNVWAYGGLVGAIEAEAVNAAELRTTGKELHEVALKEGRGDAGRR